MDLEQVVDRGGELSARSTGAHFRFDPSGSIHCSARIPAERPIARIDCGGVQAWRQVDGHDQSARFTNGKLHLEVRSDSLLRFRAESGAQLSATALFEPKYQHGIAAQRLWLDGTGGLGLYCPVTGTASRENPATRTVDYELEHGQELWISVLPPRPVDLRRSAMRIAHEGRPRPFPAGAYPSEAAIEEAAKHCQVFCLHAYFWKSEPRSIQGLFSRHGLRRRPWEAAKHEPHDPARFAALADCVRENGMELVVYLSPYYSASADIRGEMQRVLDQYPVQGLYLDGVADNLPDLDRIVREARACLGSERILYLNATNQPFGSALVHCPHVDAWADFTLRGDSGRGGLPLDEFLRYAVRGQGRSNSVGMWCDYGSNRRVLPSERAPALADVELARQCGVSLWRRSLWGPKACAAIDQLLETPASS